MEEEHDPGRERPVAEVVPAQHAEHTVAHVQSDAIGVETCRSLRVCLLQGDDHEPSAD
jgi:hypothetical protein